MCALSFRSRLGWPLDCNHCRERSLCKQPLVTGWVANEVTYSWMNPSHFWGSHFLLNLPVHETMQVPVTTALFSVQLSHPDPTNLPFPFSVKFLELTVERHLANGEILLKHYISIPRHSRYASTPIALLAISDNDAQNPEPHNLSNETGLVSDLSRRDHSATTRSDGCSTLNGLKTPVIGSASCALTARPHHIWRQCHQHCTLQLLPTYCEPRVTPRGHIQLQATVISSSLSAALLAGRQTLQTMI